MQPRDKHGNGKSTVHFSTLTLRPPQTPTRITNIPAATKTTTHTWRTDPQSISIHGGITTKMVW